MQLCWNYATLKWKVVTDFSIEKSIDGPVIGLDEVGRGPLAGPVVSCGCYFSNYDDLESEIPIND